MIRICWLLVVMICWGKIEAQNFGGFPSSTKWKQINTDTARIIFTSSNKEQAERVAAIIHRMALEQPASLGRGLKKINIVLHSNTTVANGYVGLGPFRSEYYLIPSSNIFDLGNLPWSEHLAVHEYRHVQQYNNFNRGFITKTFTALFGQEGRAFANALTIPDWFFEGDAVHAETSLTPQGRGRLPLFLGGYKSLWQAGESYRLMKLLNGSLKDYVPDHYQLGYLLVNYGYEKYGVDFWKKVTNDAAAFKGLVYPFRKGIKKHSGVGYKYFLQDAIANTEQNIKPVSDADGKKHKVVTNHYFPKIIGHDSIIYLKDSYKKIPAFYLTDQKGETKIKQRNISAEEWVSYNDGSLLYTSFSTNPRWSLTDYSDIVILDLRNKTEKKITKHGKYFTPDFSPSGKKIIAVSINEKTETELHLLNREDGRILKEVKGNDRFFIHPRFINEENIITGIRREDGSISLNKMNIATEAMESLTPLVFSVVGYPSIYNDTVYFTGAYNGNDDLYALSLTSKNILKLTDNQTGNYYADVVDDKIVYSHFTNNGLQLKEGKTATLLWQNVDTSFVLKESFIFPVAQIGENILHTPNRNFVVSSYKKGTGLINFHSWRPSYSDPEFTYTLYGNNVLNTFTTEVFYRYNQNERSHGTGVSAAYSALFPVLTVGGEYTYNRNIFIRTGAATVAPATLDAYEVNAGYYIPLNFTGGKTYKNLAFGTNYVINQLLPTGETKKILRSFNTPYLSHFLNWSQQLPKAKQNIFPKFGYAISNGYRQRLNKNGYQLISNAQLYLPSFANHSLVLSGSYQKEDADNILFSNRFSNARGYTESDSSKMWRASVNYHLPLAYPDWGFGGIIYFQRIRTNLFYDFSKLYAAENRSSNNLRSTGVELFFDTKWWNQLPVSFGIRYSYLMDAGKVGANKHQWEIIIPTDLLLN